MARLTASEVATRLGTTPYTLKRWYKWYETEDPDKIKELIKKGMPKLPAYETIGATNWKLWDEEDIDQLKRFKEFIPNTRGGFMGSLNRKEDN